MFGSQDIISLLSQVIRTGLVSSVDPATATARVVFPDYDEQVSYDLPVVMQGTTGTKGYWMPRVDEQVLCIFRPDATEQGFIVGSIYSAANPPPVSDEGAVVVAGDSVHLGDPDADDPVVRKSDLQKGLDDVRGLINDVKSAFDAHTHPVTGAVPAAPPAPPVAGPPLVPMPPPAPVTAEGSEKVFSS